jgi:hypothetical protein
MGRLSARLRSLEGGGLMFWCPGCDGGHQIQHGAGSGPRWTWNGDAERPTFTPSVRVSYNGADADTPEGIPSVCHSFVTDGRIQFLSDCTHALAGQTVDLPDAF